MLLKKSVSTWLVSGVLCQSYKFKIHEEIIKNNELVLWNFLKKPQANSERYHSKMSSLRQEGIFNTTVLFFILVLFLIVWQIIFQAINLQKNARDLSNLMCRLRILFPTNTYFSEWIKWMNHHLIDLSFGTGGIVSSNSQQFFNVEYRWKKKITWVAY